MTLAIGAEPTPLRTSPDGVVLVGKTRVPLDTVVAAFLNGATAEEIVQRYDTLDLADVYAVIAYYLRHRVEVEAYLEQRETQRANVRRETETRVDPVGIRERLLARRANQSAG